MSVGYEQGSESETQTEQAGLDQRPRILVVDDEPGVRQVIRVNLIMQGHEVLEAKNGAQALKIVEDNGIDLMILDLMMPKVSGWDVLEALKSKRKTHSMPIIVLSAITSEDAKLKAFDLGAADYVVKPFAVGELLARVTRTLHEKREKQVLAEFSITDWVTGLFNRRYLELRLPQEVSRAHRYGRSLTAVFFEIDQLPWLLDERGPQFVDGVLQQVATVVRGHTRACDVLFRYDGDYFIALLPDTPLAGGVQVADRIRADLLRTQWHDGVGLSGTFGIVELSEGEDASSLLARAEEALLYAKRAYQGNAIWPTRQEVGLEISPDIPPMGFATDDAPSGYDTDSAQAGQEARAATGFASNATPESAPQYATEAAPEGAGEATEEATGGSVEGLEATGVQGFVAEPTGVEDMAPVEQGPGMPLLPDQQLPSSTQGLLGATADPLATEHFTTVRNAGPLPEEPNRIHSVPTQHIDPEALNQMRQQLGASPGRDVPGSD